MNDKEKIFEWKKRVFLLDLIDTRLEESYKQGKITKQTRNKIKKKIDRYWINIWDFYPDDNPSVKQAFKLNFD